MADNPVLGLITFLGMAVGALLLLTAGFSPPGNPLRRTYLIIGVACLGFAFVSRFYYMLMK